MYAPSLVLKYFVILNHDGQNYLHEDDAFHLQFLWKNEAFHLDRDHRHRRPHPSSFRHFLHLAHLYLECTSSSHHLHLNKTKKEKKKKMKRLMSDTKGSVCVHAQSVHAQSVHAQEEIKILNTKKRKNIFTITIFGNKKFSTWTTFLIILMNFTSTKKKY